MSVLEKLIGVGGGERSVEAQFNDAAAAAREPVVSEAVDILAQAALASNVDGVFAEQGIVDPFNSAESSGDLGDSGQPKITPNYEGGLDV